MIRWLRVLPAVFLGVLLGALTVVAIQAPAVPPDPSATPSGPTDVTPAAPTPSPRTTAPAGRVPNLLLVWTPGGLPPELASGVAALPGVEQVTEVAGDTLEMVATRDAAGAPVDGLEDGWVIPLDGLAVDPATYVGLAPTASKELVGSLGSGRALLGRTSAELRGIGVGGTVVLAGGVELAVSGVVDDEVVGAAEVVVASEDAAHVGISTPRSLLLTYRGERAEVEAAIRGLLPGGVEARVRGPGETPYLRHGDAVLPQALIKDRFGEFAYRSATGRTFTPDPDWVEQHIVEVAVPILGTVRCHRGIVKALGSALGELERRGLAHLVDADDYAGCWNPRFIGEGRGLSRHAWGVAVDLNARANATGVEGAQDPRLVEVMERWGFTWGGFWLVPDPMHFEYAEPPLEPPVGD